MENVNRSGNYRSTILSRLFTVVFLTIDSMCVDEVCVGLRNEYYIGITIGVCCFTLFVVLKHLFNNIFRSKGFYFKVHNQVISCILVFIGYYILDRHLSDDIVVVGFVVVGLFYLYLSCKINICKYVIPFGYVGSDRGIVNAHPNDNPFPNFFGSPDSDNGEDDLWDKNEDDYYGEDGYYAEDGKEYQEDSEKE